MSFCLPARMAAACVFITAAVLALQPAWAQPAGQIGNIAYSISSAPNAQDARALAMSANDTRYRMMGYATMTAMVHGACAQVMTAQVVLLNDPKLKLEQFRASRSSRDLPLQDLLQVTGRVLANHCGVLQVLRVTIQNYGYEGTVTAAGGWVLQDGHVPTEFDASARVDLRIDDATGTLRVLHRGTCEAEPKLLMEPSQPLLDLSDKLFYDYAALAINAAAQYARQCRMTQRVSFALAHMPSTWLCAQPGDCFMEARLVDGRWTSDFGQLKPREVENPIGDFIDMVEVLAAGRFDILKDYDDYFGYFAWSYFNAYSEVCRSHIRQPVGRVTRYTSVKTVGGVVVSEESSETTPVFVESAHAWVYDVSQLKGSAYLTRRLLRVKSVADGLFLAGDAKRARQLVEGRCTDELVLAVQQNLLNHAAGQPPVVGKYTTSKKPIARVEQDGQSAPQFTKAYVLQRQERFATAAQPAADSPRVPTPTPPNATLDVPPAAGTGTPPPSAPLISASELQRQYVEAVAKLEQDYRAQMQQAGVFKRATLEAELKYKKLMIEREYRENLKRAQRP